MLLCEFTCLYVEKKKTKCVENFVGDALYQVPLKSTKIKLPQIDCSIFMHKTNLMLIECKSAIHSLPPAFGQPEQLTL